MKETCKEFIIFNKKDIDNKDMNLCETIAKDIFHPLARPLEQLPWLYYF